jgi:hypothetical protein
MPCEIITYESRNAPKSRRWIAYISTPDMKDYWPVRFYGESEQTAHFKAYAHYSSCEEKREKNIKAREEARERMRERAKKKAEEV